MEEAQETSKPTIFAKELSIDESPRARRASVWARLRRSPSAMIGLVLVVLLLLTALTADLIAPQGIDEQDLRKGLLPPSREFPLGTDEFGYLIARHTPIAALNEFGQRTGQSLTVYDAVKTFNRLYAQMSSIDRFWTVERPRRHLPDRTHRSRPWPGCRTNPSRCRPG